MQKETPNTGAGATKIQPEIISQQLSDHMTVMNNCKTIITGSEMAYQK